MPLINCKVELKLDELLCFCSIVTEFMSIMFGISIGFPWWVVFFMVSPIFSVFFFFGCFFFFLIKIICNFIYYFFFCFNKFFIFFFFLVFFFFFHANDWYCSLAFRESGIFCDNFVANNSLLICFSSNSEWFCFYFWFCFVRWYFYKNYKFCNNNKNFHDNCRN